MKRLMTGAALALTLSGPTFAQDASTVMATVNGTEITLGHMIAMRDRLPAQYQELPDEVLFNGMLEQLIQQQVLAEAASDPLATADALGLENERRAFLAGRMIDRTASAPLDEDAVQAAYDEAFASVEPEKEWNASHILVETEEEAAALIVRAEAGEDFAELAREASTGPSGPSGGALGWFGTGQMVPEFEQAVAGLEDGAVSTPVQTQFGWHVVKLNESRDRAAPPLEQVRAQIEEELRTDAVDAEVQRLVDAAEITRNEDEVDVSLISNSDLLSE